jgi:hypothetical protein
MVALLTCDGGSVTLPATELVLVDREDGGNLIVHPPRDVWERRELTPHELTAWSFLIAATASAMLDTLPQLRGGCINYWEAGNWSLNDAAPPAGRKTAREYRRVHMHLLGRSPNARHADWEWGEAPMFPRYADRFDWASRFKPLTADECDAVIARTSELLRSKYALSPR